MDSCLLALNAFADVAQAALPVTVVKMTTTDYKATEKLRGTIVAKDEIIISAALE